MKRFKYLVLLLLTIGLVFSGCTKTPENTTEDEKNVCIAMFIVDRASEYDQARIDGVESKADELNAEVSIFSCEYDTQEQINQIQDAITADKYDAFIIHPNDSNAVVPAIEDALKLGIVVIGADGPFGPDTRSLDPYPEGVTSIIGRTGWDTGHWLGEAVLQASEGQEKTKVAYLIGIQALSIDQDRYEALEAVIKDHPNIEVVALQEGEYRRDISREVMQNVLQANPDINVVVSSGDQMTFGAYDAAVEMGIEDNIKFIGSGCSKEGWEAVKAGKFFASYADIPNTQGKLLVENAVKAVHGESVSKSIDLEKQSPPLPEEGPLINQQNVDQFKSEW